MSARVPRRVSQLGLQLLRDLSTTERLVLLAIAVLHVVGLGWGLPASDGWDVDGVAPRDFLPGLVATFTPGDHYTYPPVHLAILAVLTLPVTLVALARAPSLGRTDVIQTFIDVPVMTTFAFTARIVSVLMSLGIVLAVGQMASAIFGPRARPWAMAIAGVEVAGTYYAHTTNLDIPALFWSSLALLVLVRAVKDDDPRKLRRVAILAALAISSKDQAYANFALSVPAALTGWVLDRGPGRRREVLRESLYLVLIVTGLLACLDAAVVNPTGFAARVRYLTGPASQCCAQYSNDWPGRLAALRDAITFLPNHYPTALAPVFGLGIVLGTLQARGRERIAALVPLLAVLSFTLTFNCVARRIEERFMMPQMQLLAVYGGGAVAVTLERGPCARSRALAWLVRLGVISCITAGVRLSASVVATMLGDARYDAERYLQENARAGDVVEIYGNNVYLPRFSKDTAVQRTGPGPITARNPMPGIIEKQDLLGNIHERRPRFVVVSTGYAWRFLDESGEADEARVRPPGHALALADVDATSHFRDLFKGRAGYRVAHVAHYQGSYLLPPRPLGATLGSDVWIFERQ